MATFEYKGIEYEFPDNWTDEQALKAIRLDRGEAEQKQTTPQPQGIKIETNREVLGKIASIGKGIVKPTIEFYKGAPSTAAYVAKSPIQTIAGMAKGAARGAINFANVPITIAGSGATNPWVKEHVKPIPTYWLEPKGVAQEKGAASGEYVFNTALSAVPIGKVAQMATKKTISTLAEMSAKKGVLPQGVKTAQEIKETAKQLEKQSPKSGVLSSIDTRERNMLFEPLAPKDTPFTNYAEQSIKSMKDAREMTAMDLVGVKAADKVLPELTELRNVAGKELENVIAKNADKAIQLNSVRNNFKKLVRERLGMRFDAEGNVIAAKGHAISKPSEKTMVENLWKYLNETGKNEFDYTGNYVPIKMAVDIKRAIADIVEAPKATQVKQIYTTSEGIGEAVKSQIDDLITAQVGNEYKLANIKYGNLRSTENMLNKKLGEVIGEDGVPRMGASLMKSAVMSNSDRGTKALFNEIKKLTGYDLVKESMYAKIAMDAVGDSRATDLLKSMAETRNLVGGWKTQAGMKLGTKALDKIRGNKINQLINYYNRVQRIPLK